jgi:hypothetical protein
MNALQLQASTARPAVYLYQRQIVIHLEKNNGKGLQIRVKNQAR